MHPGVPSTDPRSVAPDAYLLDVREAEEWVAGHAPDAVHMPMSTLTATVGDVPQDRDVVVVCRSGARSARVTAFLNANGWRAVNLDGGMQSWSAAGLPMTSETGAPPAVV